MLQERRGKSYERGIWHWRLREINYDKGIGTRRLNTYDYRSGIEHWKSTFLQPGKGVELSIEWVHWCDDDILFDVVDVLRF